MGNSKNTPLQPDDATHATTVESPKLTVYGLLPEGHPLYSLIGLIAAEAAHTDQLLDWIIWELARIPSEIGACVTAQLVGMFPRYRAIYLLAEHHNLSAKLRKEIKRQMDFSSDPGNRRNRVIHDPWYQEQETLAPQQFRTKPGKNPKYGFEPVDETKLRESLTVIRTHKDRVFQLRRDIKAEIGS